MFADAIEASANDRTPRVPINVAYLQGAEDILNIREYLENEDKRLGEDTLVQLLSEFSCPLNPDVERFFSMKYHISYRKISG